MGRRRAGAGCVGLVEQCQAWCRRNLWAGCRRRAADHLGCVAHGRKRYCAIGGGVPGGALAGACPSSRWRAQSTRRPPHPPPPPPRISPVLDTGPAGRVHGHRVGEAGERDAPRLGVTQRSGRHDRFEHLPFIHVKHRGRHSRDPGGGGREVIQIHGGGEGVGVDGRAGWCRGSKGPAPARAPPGRVGRQACGGRGLGRPVSLWPGSSHPAPGAGRTPGLCATPPLLGDAACNTRRAEGAARRHAPRHHPPPTAHTPTPAPPTPRLPPHASVSGLPAASPAPNARL